MNSYANTLETPVKPIDLAFECMQGNTLIFTSETTNRLQWYGFVPNAAFTEYTTVRFTDANCLTRALTFVNMPLLFIELPTPTDIELPALARANFIAWLEETGIEL